MGFLQILTSIWFYRAHVYVYVLVYVYVHVDVHVHMYMFTHVLTLMWVYQINIFRKIYIRIVM